MIDCITALPGICDAASDKDKKVAAAADALARSIFAKAEYWSASVLLKALEKALDGKAKPVTKELALDLVYEFSQRCPKSLAREIEWLIQPVVLLMNDIKASVKSKAKKTMEAMCFCCGNKDLIGSDPDAVVYSESFIPTIIKANESLKNVSPVF